MRIALFDSKDINIVEFSVGKPSNDCPLCSENSKFIHGSIFSLIQQAFSLSNSDFSYFEKTEYHSSKLPALRNHLQILISGLMQISSVSELEVFIMKQPEGIVFMNELKTWYPKWKIEWEKIKEKIKRVIEDLIEMVDICIDEDLNFIVKGY